MRRLCGGALLFIVIFVFFAMQGNMHLAMNSCGIIGISGILVGGFLKTGFISSTAPVIGNLAIIKLDDKLDISNTVLLITLPNLIGALILYFFDIASCLKVITERSFVVLTLHKCRVKTG